MAHPCVVVVFNVRTSSQQTATCALATCQQALDKRKADVCTCASYYNHVVHCPTGLKAIYLSGWQVAADANTAGQTYPDQSLYPVDSVPNVVRKINNAFM